MHRRFWMTAALVLSLGAIAGCSGSSTTSKPAAPPTGTPKADDGGKSKANVSGVENPPPP